MLFPVGTTTIFCSPTNNAGLTSTGHFSITVNACPPVITCPHDLTVECVSAGSASISFSVTAHDNQQGNITSLVACDHTSGAKYGLAARPFFAQSELRESVPSCTFKINVQDTDFATNFLSSPAQSQSPRATNILSNCERQVLTEWHCGLVLSSQLLFLTRLVSISGTCTATDLSGNHATCDFTYTVAIHLASRAQSTTLKDRGLQRAARVLGFPILSMSRINALVAAWCAP